MSQDKSLIKPSKQDNRDIIAAMKTEGGDIGITRRLVSGGFSEKPKPPVVRKPPN